MTDRSQSSSAARRWGKEIAAALIISAVVGWLASRVWQQIGPEWSTATLWEYRQLLWKGWRTTLMISAAAILGSILVGLVLMLAQRSSVWVWRATARALTEIVRATPFLVQLLVGYFLIFAPLLARPLSESGWNEKNVIGIILLSLFSGAYLGEILRGGVDSIPAAQWESARAVGFSRWQTYRHVIFPQALRRVLPAIAGQFMSLIKDSSLLSVVAVQEFAYQARTYTSQTYGGLEAYLPLAVGYLILTLPVALLAHFLERRFRHAA
jgi:polar amino acid transport system permease protein